MDGVLIENWKAKRLLDRVYVANLPLSENTGWRYTYNKNSPFTTKLALRKRGYQRPALEATIEGPGDCPYLFIPFGWRACYKDEERQTSTLRFIILEPALSGKTSSRGRTRGKIDLGKEIPDKLTIYPPLMMLTADQYLTDILTASMLPISVITSVVKYNTAGGWLRFTEHEKSGLKWVNPTIIEAVNLAKQLFPPKFRMPHL